MQVVDIHKKELNKRNISSFEEWIKIKDTVYIGRNMNFYVKGAVKSKWANPFTTKKYPNGEALIKYEEYLRNNNSLLHDIKELKHKILGCWCINTSNYTNIVCHGQILMKLYDELYGKPDMFKEFIKDSNRSLEEYNLTNGNEDEEEEHVPTVVWDGK